MEDLFDELVTCVIEGDVDRVAVLLDRGADVNGRNERGETPFSYACAYNQLAAARLLHARGADINSIDLDGFTPLDSAVCHASPEFRAWLTALGGKRNREHAPWPWPPRDTSDAP